MSIYLVNKFLYQVDRDETALLRYMADPEKEVTRWEQEKGPFVTEVEKTTGHSFTAAERQALARQDYEALYAMGAHPFLLWTLMLPILEPQYPSFDALIEAYNEAIGRHGYPDFAS